MRTPTSDRSRAPLWLVEAVDIAERRRGALLAVALGAAALGVLLAVLAPGIVPPTPLVGAAIGLGALLLGYAAAMALDTADLVVRGPRHVRAAGGEVVAVVPTEVSAAEAGPLAEAVLEARDADGKVRLGLAAAGRDAAAAAQWSEALAVAMADRGSSVLWVDLASGRSTHAGVAEVTHGDVPLHQAVELDPERRLARLGSGGNAVEALAALPSLTGQLPRDLDALIVSLPTAASREVVTASRSLAHVLVIAERDQTARVDLIAALDALDAAGTAAQALLIDDLTAGRLHADATGLTAAEAATAEPDPASAPAAHDDPSGGADDAGEASDRGPAPGEGGRTPADRGADATTGAARTEPPAVEPEAAEPAPREPAAWSARDDAAWESSSVRIITGPPPAAPTTPGLRPEDEAASTPPSLPAEEEAVSTPPAPGRGDADDPDGSASPDDGPDEGTEPAPVAHDVTDEDAPAAAAHEADVGEPAGPARHEADAAAEEPSARDESGADTDEMVHRSAPTAERGPDVPPEQRDTVPIRRREPEVLDEAHEASALAGLEAEQAPPPDALPGADGHAQEPAADDEAPAPATGPLAPPSREPTDQPRSPAPRVVDLSEEGRAERPAAPEHRTPEHGTPEHRTPEHRTGDDAPSDATPPDAPSTTGAVEADATAEDEDEAPDLETTARLELLRDELAERDEGS